MKVLIVSLEAKDDFCAVTVDRGKGPEVYEVKNKEDLFSQLKTIRAKETDLEGLKSLVGLTWEL